MNLFLSKNDIDLEFKSGDFILKTQQQIIKDFNQSGINFNVEFSLKKFDYNQIILEIESKLIEVVKLGETKLLELLYQIDIPQSDFTTLLKSPKISSELSKLILQREAYKVHLRGLF